ncbi:MAG: hypothetical protein CL397_12445 [Acidiferrobacteraceae bacterium]|nr:hypothetical protein [Acidiferrobacteraceae bacterium]
MTSEARIILHRLLGFAGHLAGFHSTSCTLVPLKDVHQSAQEFVCTGIDPQFQVIPRREGLRSGWYIMSYQAKVLAPDALFTPKIYPRLHDSPASEKNVITLRAHVDGKIRHLFHFPTSAAEFRFDPFDLDLESHLRIEAPVRGRFRIDRFRLTCIRHIPLLFFILRHGLLASRSHLLGRLAKVSSLCLRRDVAAAKKWLTHKTNMSLIPSFTVASWYQHYLGSSDGHRDQTEERLEPHPVSLINLVLFVTRGSVSDLNRTIASVLRQNRRLWRLLIICSPETTPDLRHCATKLAVKHSSIHVGGTDWLSLSGEPKRQDSNYLAVINLGDLLTADAVRTILHFAEITDADIIYGDEAYSVDDESTLQRLTLRHAFSFDELLAAPCLGFLTAIRTCLLPSDVAMPAVATFALNEWLILQSLYRARRISHIPALLYIRQLNNRQHLRLEPEYFQEFLHNVGFRNATVRPVATPGCRAIRYHGGRNGKTAIIIPTHNKGDMLEIAVNAILRTVSADRIELLVVDHKSDDDQTQRYLSELSENHTVIRYNEPFNFSRINNMAVRHINKDCDTVLFMNNDVEALEHGWLASMLDKIGRTEIGAVGATLLYPDNKIQHAGVITGMGVADHYMGQSPYVSPYLEDVSNEPMPWIVTRDFSAVTAACLLLRTTVFTAIGGFDEKLSVGFQDIDLCLRLRKAGYKILCDGEAVLRHYESITRAREDKSTAIADPKMPESGFGLGIFSDPHPEDSVLFTIRYQKQLGTADPYYHPALSRLTRQFRLSRGLRKCTQPEPRTVDWAVPCPIFTD